MPRPLEQRITCAAFSLSADERVKSWHEGVADHQWPTLCRKCSGKIRAADLRASSTSGIRKEMRDEGLL